MHYALVLLALGGLLTIHELGHLVAARMLGVRVPRFVFGFGPPLVSFRLWGTQYVVAAVPLGATAHLQGMNPHRAEADEAAGFAARGPLLRILIVLAGPLANYALALGVLFALYTSGTHVVVPLTVGTVQPGSEAARAQLLPGDRIVNVAGQPLRSWSEFVEKVGAAPGVPLELGVERGGEARSVVVRPRPDERGTGRIGVSQQYVYKAHGAGEALSHSFTHTVKVAEEGVTLLKRMMQHGLESADAASPGALVRQESADAMSSGTDALLRTLVAASVVLALLTLLPVPGLDGGRVVLLLVEAASGRRIPPRVETVAQTVGFLGIAVAVVLMATAEIRRALPARLGLEESQAHDAGAAQVDQPPAATAGSANGTVPSPAPSPATPGKVPGTTAAAPGTGPAGATASTAAGANPTGAAAPTTANRAGPGGPTTLGSAGKPPSGTDAGTQATTATAEPAKPPATSPATPDSKTGQEAATGATRATPPEADAGAGSAPTGATAGAAPSTGPTPSEAPSAPTTHPSTPGAVAPPP
ncbi:site-2 protease family protein [Myxococcus xanthus]|uniref:M50 family metallopeptidase n=1 Tax=Myxococcus xanthus TaxID=34 RepID=UPI0019171419|nr:M50 family metallopeptidase [Myxococcus xanthus]QQR46843.1 site-2 protease family protein [Myxococcus xanthus]